MFRSSQRQNTAVAIAVNSSVPSERSRVSSALQLENSALTDLDIGEPQVFTIPREAHCRLVAKNEPLGVGPEQFQTLASRLRYCQSRRGISSLLITSAVPGEGKTVIAANLGITFAQHQQKVLIIDGDMRHPGLGSLLNVRNHAGLGDWWIGKGILAKNIVREEHLPLWVLPAGIMQDWPLCILQSQELQEALHGLRGRFDWILIDAPPLMPFADASAWAALSDSILLVTRRGVTPTNLLRQALKSIDTTKVVASILNENSIVHQQYYHRYYAKQLAATSFPHSQVTD